MVHIRKMVGVAFTLSVLARAAAATESIEFVAEHLAEIGMDNRYASLPLWSGDSRFDLNAGYSHTHTGTLSIDGPMTALGASLRLNEKYRLAAFMFFDDLALSSGIERRPLEVTFASAPLSLPADAEFTGLDGQARDVGFGLALKGSAHFSWLPWFEWSAGLMWQQLTLQDYRFDYRILEGKDAGTTGRLDYSSTYEHISPFFGAAWPRARGNWHYAPHVQMAVPLPRRGVVGRITGPGFDLAGSTADNGDKPFGDPSVTLGFNLTYEPWRLTMDLGSTITQYLFEPRIHEGVDQNVMLSLFWSFE